MFLYGLLIVKVYGPLPHIVKVKDAKMPKSFFGSNSAAYDPTYTTSTDHVILVPRERGRVCALCLAL